MNYSPDNFVDIDDISRYDIPYEKIYTFEWNS